MPPVGFACVNSPSYMSENQSPENQIAVEGVFEPSNNKTGQLLDPTKNGRQRHSDPFIPRELVRRFKLKRGQWINANAIHDERFPNPKVRYIEAIDGLSVEDRRKHYEFSQLTTIAPNERLKPRGQRRTPHHPRD